MYKLHVILPKKKKNSIMYTYNFKKIIDLTTRYIYYMNRKIFILIILQEQLRNIELFLLDKIQSFRIVNKRCLIGKWKVFAFQLFLNNAHQLYSIHFVYKLLPFMFFIEYFSLFSSEIFLFTSLSDNLKGLVMNEPNAWVNM